MNKIKPVRTEADYEAALARIDELMDAAAGSRKGAELDVLADLVELYETKHEPMGYPSPVAAIKFRMDQAGLRPRDLVPFIGSRAKVSEVLSGKRTITMTMARALHEHLGIPAKVLLRKPDLPLDKLSADIEWQRFPLRVMAKRGWIPSVTNLAKHAETLINDLIEQAGDPTLAPAALYRKNDHLRVNAKTDEYALKAWCWYVLAKANENRPSIPYRRGTVTLNFLKRVARLSPHANGPRRAQRFLAKHGIVLVIERHLNKTYLDGATLRLGDGRPVIGLTLRYDRIDNFWFCLLHELAHVGRHLDRNQGDTFIDDQTLRRIEGARVDSREIQADEWAEEALIPRKKWEATAIQKRPKPKPSWNWHTSCKSILPSWRARFGTNDRTTGCCRNSSEQAKSGHTSPRHDHATERTSADEQGIERNAEASTFKRKRKGLLIAVIVRFSDFRDE